MHICVCVTHTHTDMFVYIACLSFGLSMYVCTEQPNEIQHAKNHTSHSRVNNTQARNWGQWHEASPCRGVTRGWKKSSWVAMSLKCPNWQDWFQLNSLFLRTEASQNWYEIQAATHIWKCFGNVCTNRTGHFYSFVPMPGRAPSCLSQHASSGVYSQHSLHSAKEDRMWTIFQRGESF